MSARDMDALDRGVIEAGLTAAEAIARVAELERRLEELRVAVIVGHAYAEYLSSPPPKPSARKRAAELGWGGESR